MNARYILHYAPDNASAIVRLALEELRLPYDTHLVDRRTNAQRGAAHLALNPAGRIPVLETPDGPLFETAAILLWLADRHGALAPAPQDPARGQFLTWLFFLSNTLHPDLLMCFYTNRFGPEQAQDDIRRAAQLRIARHIALLEQAASTRLPGWFAALDPSALDLYTAFLLRWARLYPTAAPLALDMGDFPRLNAMLKRLETRPSGIAVAKAEGLGSHPFTAPAPANPPEGVAL